MAEGGTERRLAAIVAIDVAGYSRLMGADEDGTLATMKAHREINFPIGEKHGGRVVGTAGDGVLWEFPSITEAVAASIEIQARMAEINADIPDDRKMLYRIGINLGDVMVDGDDIYGDGINVAARIEALATPGGICLSRAARDQVRDRMDINLEDMGEVEVKNIARPVRVFKVLADGQSAAVPAKTKPKWMIPVIAAAVLLVTIIGGGAWWWMLQPDFEPADPKKYAYRLPQAPSIAVLPFDYLGDDKKANEYLSDGLTENIIAVLATSPDLFVIARNSSFTYKGKPVKVQQVAENLGVRYVLEGSVQRFGDKLRVTAQLIDALNGKHLWAERYDRQLTDFLRIQDEIAQQILVQLHAKLSGGAGTIGVAKNFGQDMEGYRQFTIALEKFQSFTKKGHHEAIAIYQDLLQKNPKNFSVVGMMGWLQWQKALLGLSKNRSKTLREARKFAEKSLSLRENKDRAYSVYGLMAWLDLLELKHKGAIENADRTLIMAPSTSAQGAAAGQIKGASGQYAEAVEIIRRAMRVEPDYAQWIPSALQWFLIALGRHDEAKEIANGVLLSRTTITNTQGAALRHLAVIAVFEDEVDVARSYIKRLRKLKPKWSVSGVLRSNYYFKNQDFIKRYANALRKAGLPEYPPGKGPKAKPKKPSIAVLPFANLSDDKEQEYFADGMTDDLITDLSKLSGLIVIARNSVFTYKGKAVKVQEIAKDLNVTHVLEGSVRRSGGKVRINAQLIDAQTGAHLWAEIFDREFTEIFALQDDVREKIVAALKVTLTADEKKKLARRPTANLKAYETYLRAREAHQRFDAPGLTKALKLYQEAIDLDPTFADAYAGDALAATVIYFKGLFWILKEDDARQRAEQSITRALKFDPGNVNAFRARARIKSINGRHDDAIATARHAVAANPNKASAHRSLASALLFAGRKDQALREVEAAGRLDPKPDVIDGAASGLV